MLQTFRLPDHASACAAARGLQRQGLTTRAGVRQHLAYLTVRSDRADVGALVRALEPAAVPVFVHLPSPRPRALPHDLPRDLPRDLPLVS